MITRGNKPPVASKPLSNKTLRDVAEETSFYIGNIFCDPDGDEMTYEVTVSNTSIATARTSGDYLFIKPSRFGNTYITLIADDKNTGRTPTRFSLEVTRNQSPVIEELVSGLILIPYSDPFIIDLKDHTRDPEGDYPLSFNAFLSVSGIVNVDIKDGVLTIDPRRHGNVELQIRAADRYSATSAPSTINIRVEQKYAPDQNSQLLVYPNPTSSTLWYSFVLNDKPASVTIRITDASGKTMFLTQAENLTEGAHYQNINIQNWSAGIYFVQYIKDGVLRDVKKIVKH